MSSKNACSGDFDRVHDADSAVRELATREAVREMSALRDVVDEPLLAFGERAGEADVESEASEASEIGIDFDAHEFASASLDAD